VGEPLPLPRFFTSTHASLQPASEPFLSLDAVADHQLPLALRQ
jgi:hypothetical protein